MLVHIISVFQAVSLPFMNKIGKMLQLRISKTASPASSGALLLSNSGMEGPVAVVVCGQVNRKYLLGKKISGWEGKFTSVIDRRKNSFLGPKIEWEKYFWKYSLCYGSRNSGYLYLIEKSTQRFNWEKYWT